MMKPPSSLPGESGSGGLISENPARPVSGPTESGRVWRVLALLFVSCLLFIAAPVVSACCRWTNFSEALPVVLLFGGILFGMMWAMVVLPLNLIVLWICRWRRWPRSWPVLVLLPTVVMAGCFFHDLNFHMPALSERMALTLETQVPASASDVRVYYFGGFTADFGDVYSFRCRPEETLLLIERLKLLRDNPIKLPPAGGPWGGDLLGEVRGWESPESYSGYRDEGSWFYTLYTDATKTRVCIRVGCI